MRAVWLLGVSVLLGGAHLAVEQAQDGARALASADLPTAAEGAALADRILSRHRKAPQGQGPALVDYAALARDPGALQQVRAWYAQTSPDTLTGAPDRLAYWVNGYNISMIAAVLDAWGGNPGWSVSESEFAIFNRRIHDFGGLRLTLNEIEHVVLRGDGGRFTGPDGDRERALQAHGAVWAGSKPDARIHMVLNCASWGCPNLPARALTASNLEATLAAASRRYVSNQLRGAGPKGVSQLFSWYGSDFGGPEGVKSFVGSYREGQGEVAFDAEIPYDWRLNIAQ